MKISVLAANGDVKVLELPEGDIDVTVQLIAAAVGISVNELKISHSGNDYNGDSFSSLDLKNEDIISVEKIQKRNIHLHAFPANVTPQKDLVGHNPHLLTELQSADPEMAKSVCMNDTNPVRMLMMKRMLDVNKVKYDLKVEKDGIWADPVSYEHQRITAERINMQNPQSQIETAMNEMPDTFGSVHMLYINIEVNGHPVKAFVDSGAQSTIMSVLCAERCGVAGFAGEARGVATSNIMGRVHIAQMKLGGGFFPISLTVLQNTYVDMLFGLDMLKRYRCIIDLSANVLRIETTSGMEEAPFLAEADLPRRGVGHSSGQSQPSDVAPPHVLTSSGAPHLQTAEPPSPSTPRRNRSRASSFGTTESDSHLVNQDVIYLTSLGFSIVEASNALSQAEGDVQLAAELLFASRT